MAGTINYLYDPNQAVWVITDGKTCDTAVLAGTIIQVKGNVLTTGQTLKYDVRLATDNGTNEFLETDIFATLNAAVTEYEIRLT